MAEKKLKILYSDSESESDDSDNESDNYLEEN